MKKNSREFSRNENLAGLCLDYTSVGCYGSVQVLPVSGCWFADKLSLKCVSVIVSGVFEVV